MSSTGLTVITGAAGHVGANLSRALLARGRPLRLLVREDTRAVDGLEAEVERADVTDPESLRRAFRGAETVYHLAARISIVGPEGGLVERTNVLGPRHVVEACLHCGVRRLVHFSSIHAFMQEPLEDLLDETRGPAPDPGGLTYDRTKAAGEREILAGVERGLNAVIVNPTSILGPHDYKPSRMGSVMLGLYRRSFPALVEGGFDWVDVRDAVAGALAAEERGRTGERYLLSGAWCTVSELAAQVAAVTGVPAPSWTTPMWLARIGAPFATAWSRITGGEPLFTSESLQALRSNRCISHAKAAAELGYAPRPLRQTIEDTFAWYRDQGVI